MGLPSLFVDSVTHGFAVDREAGVFLAEGIVPGLQCGVEIHGVDANEDVANDRFAGRQKTSFFTAAAKAFLAVALTFETTAMFTRNASILTSTGMSMYSTVESIKFAVDASILTGSQGAPAALFGCRPASLRRLSCLRLCQ